MELAALKPWLTALIMPPASLLVALALALWWPARQRRGAQVLGSLCLALLCLLSTQAVALRLSAWLLPQYAALNLSALARSQAQAIVVLGAGTENDQAEYGGSGLAPLAYERLRYGYFLKNLSHLPLIYSGGYGWAHAGRPPLPMAQLLARVAAQDGRAPPEQIEGQSRDTHENAQMSARLLLPQHIRRIVLVTHAWHMPRSVRAFTAAGFVVTPAPMGFIAPADSLLQQWLPSGLGMQSNYAVLREWLALRLQAW